LTTGEQLSRFWGHIDQLAQPFLLVDESHWVTSGVVIADRAEHEVGRVERLEHRRR
jgi:hypothetical protein